MESVSRSQGSLARHEARSGGAAEQLSASAPRPWPGPSLALCGRARTLQPGATDTHAICESLLRVIRATPRGHGLEVLEQV